MVAPAAVTVLEDRMEVRYVLPRAADAEGFSLTAVAGFTLCLCVLEGCRCGRLGLSAGVLCLTTLVLDDGTLRE